MTLGCAPVQGDKLTSTWRNFMKTFDQTLLLVSFSADFIARKYMEADSDYLDILFEFCLLCASWIFVTWL
jgi:hypothetical protein